MLKIKARSAVVADENGKLHEFQRADQIDEDSIDPYVLEQLYGMPDTFEDPEAPEGALGMDATTPENQERIRAELEARGITPDSPPPPADDDPPPGTFDTASASVEDVARHIQEKNLNASATVALARNDAALAVKVVQAEKLSAGGDGRTTVTAPLEKLALSGGTT